MWETLNQIIIAAEIILTLIGIFFVYGKKNALKTLVFLSSVFVLNFTIYTIPAFYEKIVLEAETNFLFYLLDIFPATAKSLVGDASTGMVEGYTAVFPVYAYIYSAALALGFVSTSFAAISTFGLRILNVFKIASSISGKSCDIVAGSENEALVYAKSYKNSIVILPENSEKNYANELVNSGYYVMRKKITKEFLNSRFFNCKTRYNVIFPNEKNNYYSTISDIIAYFDTCKKTKNFYFYVEADENAIVTAKRQIDALGEKYREKITLFSRNELIARNFVDENPITKDMPKSFFEEDTSVKKGIGLNVFMLGFSSLSREIYKQFVINNQLAVYDNGEYRAFPVNYFIYDKGAKGNLWEINGLSDTLNVLSKNKDEYFPIPDMPYKTECVREDSYEFDCIKEITKTVDKENGFSYIIIDSGNIYKNIEIADRFKLLLDKCNNFRIFIYNNSSLPEYGGATCYGDTQSLFTHDVIVNEELANLAKSVNKFYSGKDNWSELTYFDMYSNISLACNLRFKLNLLGLDYVKDSKGNGEHLVKEACKSLEDKNFTYSNYFDKSKKNALLAQEHFRWNAYHLMCGYLPMKKKRIIVEKGENDKIKKVVKNNTQKKHSCITTYKGLDELSKYLADKADIISGSKTHTPKDFDYYKYDDLLIRTMADFLKENKYSAIEK